MEGSVAMLIDWENIKYSAINHLNSPPDIIILKKIARRHGKLAIARAYANWSDPQHEGDMQRFSHQDIEPVFVQTKRRSKPGENEQVVKGSVDIKLACDAIEILFNVPHISTFVLASGDGGFEHIASKIKAYGKEVAAVGIRANTSGRLGLINDVLHYYEDWVSALKPLGSDLDPAVEKALTEFSRATEDVRRDGINNSLQSIKAIIRKKNPEFEEEEIGFPTFRHLAYLAEMRKIVKVDSTTEPAKAYLPNEINSDEGTKLVPSVKWDKFINALQSNIPYSRSVLSGLIRDREIYIEQKDIDELLANAIRSRVLWLQPGRYYDAKRDRIVSPKKYYLDLTHPRVQVYRTVQGEQKEKAT